MFGSHLGGVTCAPLQRKIVNSALSQQAKLVADAPSEKEAGTEVVGEAEVNDAEVVKATDTGLSLKFDEVSANAEHDLRHHPISWHDLY